MQKVQKVQQRHRTSRFLLYENENENGMTCHFYDTVLILNQQKANQCMQDQNYIWIKEI